jgi:hypothetical protein
MEFTSEGILDKINSAKEFTKYSLEVLNNIFILYL